MKKYASYLLAGKAVSLPMFINQAAAQDMSLSQMVLTDEVHLLETGASDQVCAISNSLQTDVAARILIPDGSCSDVSDPDNMTVVITGLRLGDRVLLGASDSITEPNKAGIKLSLSDNLRILANFKINKFDDTFSGFTVSGALDSGVLNSVSIPVDLGVLSNPDAFYIQVVVISDDNTFRVSESDKVERTKVGCDSYGNVVAGAYCSSSGY